MDAKGIATLFADTMIAHRGRLQVDQRAAQQVQDALTHGADELSTGRASQGTDAKNLLAHWKSKAADGFEHTSQSLGREMHGVSTAGTQAATIVEGLAQSVSTAHGATQSLIDEYTARATTLLRAGQSTSDTALVGSLAKVIDLAKQYGRESGQLLSAADGTVRDATTQLTALTTQLRADHLVTPKVPPASSSGATKHAAKPRTASKIIDAARSELGYHERGDNIDKFGPPGQPWCSYFATAMWRKAGVNIPNYGFTGDVYDWGVQHHLAYGADHLDDVRPGDVLLFGTGPSSPTTSTHIGIVEAVHGDTVTTIEGNEGNAVRRETHTLSSATFYGGVHP